MQIICTVAFEKTLPITVAGAARGFHPTSRLTQFSAVMPMIEHLKTRPKSKQVNRVLQEKNVR
jgi:hypothetical protein